MITINQISKIKYPRCFLFSFLLMFFLLSTTKVIAISTTPSPKPTNTTATPSGSLTPTVSVDENVKVIRDAIKEQVDQIKANIEKKAFVGIISQITDSTITLNNFRGKQRIRITEDTTIIAANKKEIKIGDLALDNKVIAMGTVGDDEILAAKRVIVVLPPPTPVAKRIVTFGKILTIDTKNSQITLSPVKEDNAIASIITINKDTYFTLQSDLKSSPKFKDLKEGQKVFVIYFEPGLGKAAIAKSVFILP